MYCPQCGKQNPEDAAFCAYCGRNVSSVVAGSNNKCERECDDECHGRGGSPPLFLKFILAVVLVFIIVVAVTLSLRVINIAFQDTIQIPPWLLNFPYGEVCGLLVVLAILIILLSIILKVIRK